MLDLRNEPNHPLHGDYTVTITETYTLGLPDAIHPIAIAVNKPIAEILRWYLSKRNTYDEMNQTGTYCTIISRRYCTNHEDFEEEYDPFDDAEEEKEEL